jgi:hypothetical protein
MTLATFSRTAAAVRTEPGSNYLQRKRSSENVRGFVIHDVLIDCFAAPY